jgi:hypothetical protein
MSENVKEFFDNWCKNVKLSDLLQEGWQEQEINRAFLSLKFKNLKVESIESSDWVPAKLGNIVQIEYKYEQG